MSVLMVINLVLEFTETLWSVPDSLPLLSVVCAFPHAWEPPDRGHPGAAGPSDLMPSSPSSAQLCVLPSTQE